MDANLGATHVFARPLATAVELHVLGRVARARAALKTSVRPTLNPITETLGPSFPSGHTTAAAFYAAAALVLGRGLGKHGRAVLAGAAAGIAVAVACTRVFLDVHWLTDTGAGLFLGWAWFAVCCIAFGGRRFLRLGTAAEEAMHEADVEQRRVLAEGSR